MVNPFGSQTFGDFIKMNMILLMNNNIYDDVVPSAQFTPRNEMIFYSIIDRILDVFGAILLIKFVASIDAIFTKIYEFYGEH